MEFVVFDYQTEIKWSRETEMENLILAESTQFRTSQLTRSGGTLCVMLTQITMKYAILLSLFFSSAFICKDLNIQWVENLEGDFSFSKKYSLECEAWCYEYAGISEIYAKRISKDSIECHTLDNIATHSTLNFYIVNDVISNPRIELNSIADGKQTYSCNEGTMKIDEKAMKKGILKAEFDMKFDHLENPKELMFWKGKIYTKIK